ncbi:transcriptional adapter 2-alpha [Cryptococcus wingfieldii CBS 7118]|uniref:Transcriptional adapter 2 n=1 Tax=Cryptococcus wingfieldii CBS 7118 TaxID=1295528 RepID=A0A1E3J974_9TREE|nr:transcriptional adapter 2-alpha [Cryptococcus wingfieldii CBS 7118]ODN97399.1 transcriptional adapter 2-alpha [Cryptococcus wingfieldii CBS 7118]
MTVTQRRTNAQADNRPIIEPGIKYTCDFCHVDITHTVRIKCAMKQCEEVDLCPNCFCEGKEGLQHKAWHDYMVVEQNSQPIFTPDWGADEELLLISGLIQNGLGNWAEVAQHVGTRTKEECEKHYLEVFLGVGDNGQDLRGDVKEEQDRDGDDRKRRREFMPPMNCNFPYDPDEFQQRKKARIEELRKPHALPPTNAPPPVSAPTNHEVGGFMPARLEFEHEVDNEAEMAVKDMEFKMVMGYGGDEQPAAKVTKLVEEEEDEEGEGENGEAKDKKEKIKEDVDEVVVIEKDPPPPEVEDPDELEVKLAMMDIYFTRLDKREDAKEIIFDRGLTEYRAIQAHDKKLSKEERDLIHRFKPFAKFQTADDFETLIEGLIYEQALRKRISELQEYRRMGITTAAEADAYDNVKLTRAMDYPPQKIGDVLPTGARANAGQHRYLHGATSTPPPDIKTRDVTPRALPVVGRKPPAPLNLANSASLDLLSSEEQSLCSTIRVLPKPYLTIKELYIRENERRQGLLRRREARKMLSIDVNKSGKIFDFMVQNGMLLLAYEPQGKKTKEPEGIVGQVQMSQTNGVPEGQMMSGGKEVMMERVNGFGGMGNGIHQPITTEIRLA